MIRYHYQTDFELEDPSKYTNWINRFAGKNNSRIAELNYVFTSDEELLAINKEFLKHDDYTDIITFPYEEGEKLAGDIFISVDRVRDNAIQLNEVFEQELRRVMIHGVLHLLGYKDKSPEQELEMRSKEDLALKLFHVEH
jgi:rRNA maturation RNase YbeY